MFKRWFNRHKQQQKQIRFRQGYDYAAGELLRFPTLQTAKKLENHIDSARTFGEHDEFDEGIQQALQDWGERLSLLKRSDIELRKQFDSESG
tara:strand:- start:14026 stop:14301 length:276 start_codon:yes stop_codon:yes gene_type:complete